MRPPKGRQKLIDAAAKLFESQGYFSTTVEQITEEAGVSKGLVYNYFKSKEELLVGLIESATNRMETVAGSLQPEETPKESLENFVNIYLHFLQTERRFLKLQLSLMLTPELNSIVKTAQDQRAAMLLAKLTKWLQAAGDRHPKGNARLLMALLDGIALHYLCIDENYPLRTMKPRLLQAVHNILHPSSQEKS